MKLSNENKEKILKKAQQANAEIIFTSNDKEIVKAVEEAEKTGKHLAVLKARRKGYSYKISAMMTRNFYLLKESKNYAFADEMEFLTKDGILSKTWSMFDFIDENTAWYKKRQKFDTKLHRKASFVFDRDKSLKS